MAYKLVQYPLHFKNNALFDYGKKIKQCNACSHVQLLYMPALRFKFY